MSYSTWKLAWKQFYKVFVCNLLGHKKGQQRIDTLTVKPYYRCERCRRKIFIEKKLKEWK